MNGLRTLNKRQNLGTGRKEMTQLHATYKTHFKRKDTKRMNVKGWKIGILQTLSLTLMVWQVGFVEMNTTRDKEGNLIIIQWSIYQEYKFLYVLAPNRGITYMKQNLIAMKENTDKFTIMVWGFNTHLQGTD